MPRIAISGHRGLPDATTTMIDAELRALVAALADNRPTGAGANDAPAPWPT